MRAALSSTLVTCKSSHVLCQTHTTLHVTRHISYHQILYAHQKSIPDFQNCFHAAPQNVGTLAAGLEFRKIEERGSMTENFDKETHVKFEVEIEIEEK